MEAAQKRSRIAVLGGGFAGLTFAAALIKKGCQCSIKIFEERDTLLPLQQGSDTRWLHPHIYDWPAEGSEAGSAALPILNWTAARASDVVVQVLAAWHDVVRDPPQKVPIQLWCNTRHLQLRDQDKDVALIEWVGERRYPQSGRANPRAPEAQGQSALFDIIVVAVGFGTENSARSYWRNEVLAQPGLEQHASTYLVSGQGDGAMIDLLRLKISQFRQDRILSELFGGRPELVDELRTLRKRFLEDSDFSLYEAFDELIGSGTPAGRQMSAARDALVQRLRRDTHVVLQTLHVRSIGELLGPDILKTSFQNALLVYLLYRCGGFTPACGKTEEVAKRFNITEPFIVRRHGTDRLSQLQRLLPDRLFGPIEQAWEADRCMAWRQPSEAAFPGGYFGYPGRVSEYRKLGNAARAVARKEYLPGPTALLAASVAGAIAGHLLALKPRTSHLRLTIHRVIDIHGEVLLQQACNYVGVGPLDKEPTIARTFPADNATIGQAYRTRRTVRSAPKVARRDLDRAMKRLKLDDASREMAKDVQFVAAMPILQPEDCYYAPSPVCAILYFDSRDDGFNLSEQQLAKLGEVLRRAVDAARSASKAVLHRIENTALLGIRSATDPAEPLDPGVSGKLALVEATPPALDRPFVLNFDHSDLTPLAN